MANSALSNSLLYGIGSLIKAFASFFLLPLYTSILGATQYGVLNVLQTASIIISTIVTLALERSLYRLYHDYKTEKGKVLFLSTVFLAINGVGLSVVVLFILFGQYLTPYLGGVDFVTGLLPVVLYSYVNANINYFLIILQTKQEGLRYFIVSLLCLAFYNILSIAFLYLYSPTYHSIIYATLITTILICPISFIMVRHQIRLCFNMAILKRVFSFSLPILVSVLFAWLLNFSDRLFLANLSNMEDVGLYSFAAKIVSVVPLFCGAIFQSYTPYFFNIANSMTHQEARLKLMPINNTITFLVCILCIMLALIYNFLLHTIFTNEYIPSINFFYFLLIGAVLAQQTGLLNNMVYQNKKSKQLALIAMSGGLLSVCLNVFLISTIGRIGASVSNLVSSGFIVLSTYLLAKKEYYIPFNWMLVFISIFFILCMCLCDYIICDIFVQSLFKVVLLFTYVYIVIKMKIVDMFVFKIVIWKIVRRIRNT